LGQIPQQFIDDLLSRVDVVEVINQRVSLKKTGSEYNACCPFHSEKTPSFTVSPTKQFYHCFGCGAHGTAIGFIMEHEHAGFVEAIQILADQYGLTVPKTHTEFSHQNTTPNTDYYEMNSQVSQFFWQQLKQSREAIEYLQQRKLSGETAKVFNIGYAPSGWNNLSDLYDHDKQKINQLTELGLLIQRDDNKKPYDRFRDRIMFPIHDYRGRVIGFGGRTIKIDSSEAKYINSPETPVFHKGNELYGLHHVKQHNRKIDRLLIVEGYMDVVALAQAGINNAVATLGTATTEQHIQKIFKVTNEIIFCFDGDNAGRKAAWRALKNVLPQLHPGKQSKFLFLPDGEDPDSLVQKIGLDAFNELVLTAISSSDFLLNNLQSQVNLRDVDGQAQLIELVRPLFQSIKYDVFRFMLIEKLAVTLHMHSDKLAGMLGLQTAPSSQTTTHHNTNPSNNNRQPNNNLSHVKRDPVKIANLLLIQQPDLANSIIDIEKINQLNIPGIHFLLNMISHFKAGHPLSILIERYRGQAEESYLHTLMQTDIQIPESGIALEFEGAIKQLYQRYNEQKLDELINKARKSPLNNAEKDEMRYLTRSI
jgi:DNA primase